MTITISHPTNRPNFTQVNVGNLTLWFSYETVVGYQVGWSPVIASENVWGPTTGKHLNYFSEKTDRIPREEFTAAIAEVLATHSL